MGRLREVVRWILGRRRRIKVIGPSMEPTFRHGDFVLVDPRAYTKASPRVGDVVVCRHPKRSDMSLIKRVAEVDASGRLTLLGDNPEQSTDSRTLGAVPTEHVIGRVTAVLA